MSGLLKRALVGLGLSSTSKPVLPVDPFAGLPLPELDKFYPRDRIGDLSAELTGVLADCLKGEFPTRYFTYEGLWENLDKQFDHLKTKLGADRWAQLKEMAQVSKAHWDRGERPLGARLLQDMSEVLRRKEPFAYPVEMYVWPRQAGAFQPQKKH